MPNFKLLAATAAGVICATSASATSLNLTFNNSNGFGFLVTPVYVGIHDGTFDAFNVGEAATPGIEQVAELPVPPFIPDQGNRIAAERQADQDGDGTDSQGAFIPGAAGPIADGESATITVDVADPTVNQFGTFLAMVVPSNDTFFGNDAGDAYQLFDLTGSVIEQTISITAGQIYDAGTELANFDTSTQAGDDIVLSDDENGVITRLLDNTSTASSGAGTFQDLADLFGLTADVSSITRDTVFFTIDVAATPDLAPVPLPAGAALMLTGFGAFGGLSAYRRRLKKT